jgi:hypothetical protein
VPPFRRAENVALMYAQLSEPPPLLRERRPELPAAIDQVMGKALAKSPDDRYDDCMDFAAALKAACTPQPRAISDPGFRAATELAYPVRPDAAAPSAGASSPSGAAPPPVSGPGGFGPGGAGPPGSGAPAAGPSGFGVPGSGAPAAGPSGFGAPGAAPSPWAAGASAGASAAPAPPGGSLPASWFRDAPGAGGQGQGQGAPSPWSREAAPSAPSGWPADPRTGGPQPGGPASVQMNWPSDPTSALAPASRVGAPGRPGTYPSYQTPPPRRGHTGRTVLILLAILVVALIIGGVAYHVVSSHSSSAAAPPANQSSAAAPPVSSAAATSAPASSGPASAQTPSQVVQAYYQAINEHQYQTAWDLGGKNTGTTYDQYVAGFNGTASDVVEILSVNGNVVTAQLTANQTDGTAKVFAGTYTVSGGQITAFDVKRKS